ncbi:MAG: MiaB/RimO family radical SAM methylthiotransferase [Desulfovibrionaceae bacterium]
MEENVGKIFSIYTLGCKVNQYESQAIRECWEKRGALYTENVGEAEIIVINSCAVTENALKDIRAFFRSIGKREKSPFIIITGCASLLLEEECKRYFLTYVVEQKDKEKLLKYDFLKQEIPKEDMVEFRNPFALHISTFQRSRAVVKIQDGCSQNCTYCIIPSTRGAPISRSIKESIDEIRRLLLNGNREIVLSGINLRQYGEDFLQPCTFWDLYAAIEEEFCEEWHGRIRFRISSLEPCQLNEKALLVISSSKLLTPHLHISLQSASSSVLRRMNRSHYTAEELVSGIEKIQSFWKYFALGVDIIAGFPKETEEEHEKTKEILNKLPITYAHIFPYSERPGTPALAIKGSVYPHIRKERAKELRAIAEEKQGLFIDTIVSEAIPLEIIRENTGEYGMSQYYIRCRGEDIYNNARELYRAMPVRRESSALVIREIV